MKKYQLYQIIHFICFSILFLHSSKISNAQNQSKLFETYSKKQYIADLDTFVHKLTTVHPSPYEFTKEEDFWSVIKNHRASISDQTTYGEFIWMCSEIIANLDCAHSSLGWFNQESQALPMDLRFPIEVKFIDNRCYVFDPLVNQDRLKPGIEIFSINGVELPQIKAKIYKHINTQGKSQGYKRLLANAYITSYIPYAMGFPKSYRILVKGEKESIPLEPLKNYQPKPRTSPTDPCQDRLCLNFDEQSSTAIISIRSFDFYGDKFQMYTKFIDQSFLKIQKKGVKNLIIDLRVNQGGPSDASIYLLRYLSEKPFVYYKYAAFDEKKDPVAPFEDRFKGDLYVLMDGAGGSTTAHFISMVTHLKLGILIGEEINGNQLCFGGQKRFQLPHTGISYSVARYKYMTTANEFSKEQGILPDHFVIKNIEDYLTNTDAEMEYTFELIQSKK